MKKIRVGDRTIIVDQGMVMNVLMALIVIIVIHAGFFVMAFSADQIAVDESRLAAISASHQADIARAAAQQAQDAAVPSSPDVIREVTLGLVMDKDAYVSGSSVRATVTVDGGWGDAELWVYGVMDNRGRQHIDLRQIVTLDDGVNVYDLDATMPSCYGCVGVEPGNYTITAGVSQNITLSEDAVTVELVK